MLLSVRVSVLLSSMCERDGERKRAKTGAITDSEQHQRRVSRACTLLLGVRIRMNADHIQHR